MDPNSGDADGLTGFELGSLTRRRGTSSPLASPSSPIKLQHTRVSGDLIPATLCGVICGTGGQCCVRGVRRWPGRLFDLTYVYGVAGHSTAAMDEQGQLNASAGPPNAP